MERNAYFCVSSCFSALCHVWGRGGVIMYCLCVLTVFLPVTFHTSLLLRYARCMLRSTCLWHFAMHAACYVQHVYGTLLCTLHATFNTSVVLRYARCMLRSTRLWYFAMHAACYIHHVCGTSLCKDKVTRKDSKRIQQHVWSFAYRWNHKSDLKGSLANLCAKVNKRNC